MRQTIIKNIATGITKKCDILSKNENFLEVVLVDTTIKIILKKNKVFILVPIKIWSLLQRGNSIF
jgi:hypothetical protein